jgi:hypothetical protein
MKTFYTFSDDTPDINTIADGLGVCFKTKGECQKHIKERIKYCQARLITVKTLKAQKYFDDCLDYLIKAKIYCIYIDEVL